MGRGGEIEFFIDNLLVRTHFIIEMIWWTGLAPWEFEFLFPGSLTYTFLVLTCQIQMEILKAFSPESAIWGAVGHVYAPPRRCRANMAHIR